MKIDDPNIYCVTCFDELFAKVIFFILFIPFSFILYNQKCNKCGHSISGEAVRLEKTIEFEEEEGPAQGNQVAPPPLPSRAGAGARGGGAGSGAGGAVGGGGAAGRGGAGAGGRGGGVGGAVGGGRGGGAGVGQGAPKMKDTHWVMKGSVWVRTDGKLAGGECCCANFP
jgi:hypothetical protein